MKTYKLFFILLFLSACSGPFNQQKVDPELKAGIEQYLLNSILGTDSVPAEFSIQGRMTEHKIPGLSIAFFEGGEIHWTRTFGYADQEGKRAVNENTLFQAASISKPVAAAGALTLVEQSIISLDSNVNIYLKDWKVAENKFTQSQKVTLRRLVSHNAGLTVHGFRGYASDESVPSTIQVLNGEKPANSAPIVPDTEPGSIWRYSGGGYTVMQKMIEDYTGGDMAIFMDSVVLGPTGMANSTYQQPLPMDKRSNAAFGYRQNGNLVKGNWHTYPEQAAAGLWTTPSDLAHFAISVQRAFDGDSAEFIQPETAREMLSEQFQNWGLGPHVSIQGDTLWFAHGGANEGFRCHLQANARHFNGQGVAIMTNSDSGGRLMREIIWALIAQYGWNRI